MILGFPESPNTLLIANIVTTVKQLCFTHQDEQRAWLEENHATANEVWPIHYKKHTDKPRLLLDEADEEALRFGWIDGALKLMNGEKYVLRYSPPIAHTSNLALNQTD